MSLQPPPIYAPIIDDQGKATLPWILFFNQQFTGDTGDSWTPNFANLTVTGTPTFSGTIYKVSKNLAYFTAVITPATDTTSTAGTTYIDNFPLTVNKDGSCLAVGANVGGTAGMCVASNNRIYTPAWTSISVPVTVCGLIEAS